MENVEVKTDLKRVTATSFFLHSLYEAIEGIRAGKEILSESHRTGVRGTDHDDDQWAPLQPNYSSVPTGGSW